MEVKVDLLNVPSNDIPEGVYEVAIDKCDVKESKNTPGAQNLSIDLKVVGGDFDGRHIFDNISLQPQVLWRVRDFIAACGVVLSPEGFRTEELLGRRVRVTVGLEPDMKDKDKMRARVKGYALIG